MGIEHFLVCTQCNEYIDLHKAYEFNRVLNSNSGRPPVGIDCKETGFNDSVLRGGYWESRGLWFIWTHRNHGGKIEQWYDSSDEWWDLSPHLTEVFPHRDDCKIRERIEADAKNRFILK